MWLCWGFYFLQKFLVPVCCFYSWCCSYLDWIVYLANWLDGKNVNLAKSSTGYGAWCFVFQAGGYLVMKFICRYLNVGSLSGFRLLLEIWWISCWRLFVNLLYILGNIYVCCCVCASFHVEIDSSAKFGPRVKNAKLDISGTYCWNLHA
jgi:hypothetical protein